MSGGVRLGPAAVVCGEYAANFSSAVLVVAEGVFDPLAGDLVAARDAFGVHAEQDGDAVAGPLGNLGGVDAGVQPGGQEGVAQVVRAFSEQRCRLGLGERAVAGGFPCPAVNDGGGTASWPSAPVAGSARRSGLWIFRCRRSRPLVRSGSRPIVIGWAER